MKCRTTNLNANQSKLRLAAGFAVPSFGLALVVSCVLLAFGPRTANASRWVRTRDGWEHEEALRPRRRVYEPAMHPLVLASFVALASVMALVAFPAADGTDRA
jgi:hypothetical protein